ncbi:MAG: HAD family hydrolase [Clostridia bacterium]
MKKYNGVLFDLDGTVLDTLADLVDSVNYVLEKFGFPRRSQGEIRSFLGNGIRKLMERSLPEPVDAEAFEEILGCFRDYYTAHCEMKTKPYPGVRTVIDQIRKAGIPVGMVSNKNDAAVQALAETFFPGVFDVVIGQRENLAPKPAPDMVNLALGTLGLDAKRCLYVGDSEVDKMTADNANMDCALVTWGFRDVDFLATLKAEVMIDGPEELLSFLS